MSTKSTSVWGRVLTMVMVRLETHMCERHGGEPTAAQESLHSLLQLCLSGSVREDTN